MKGNRTDLGLLILRVGIGLVFLYYGSQKMLGLFGGAGYADTIAGMTRRGIPPVFANLAIVAEFFGGLGVLFGFLTPLAAFGLACTMAVATYMNVRDPGAFAAVFAGKDANKFFYPFALFFMATAIALMGAGKHSIDARVFRGGGGKK